MLKKPSHQKKHALTLQERLHDPWLVNRRVVQRVREEAFIHLIQDENQKRHAATQELEAARSVYHTALHHSKAWKKKKKKMFALHKANKPAKQVPASKKKKSLHQGAGIV